MPPNVAHAETDDELFGPPDPPVVTIAVEAPYGINPDTGKPYTMSPEARAAAGARMAAGRTAKATAAGSRRTRAAKAARDAAGPPPLSKPPGSSSSRPKAKSRRSQAEALAELVDAVGWGMGTFGKRFGNRALIADGMAIGMYGGPLAEAAAEWAAENPHVERALGFLDRVSPYTKMAAAAAPLLAQLAANHRMIPPGLMGAVNPDELADRFLANTQDVGGPVTPDDPDATG